MTSWADDTDDTPEAADDRARVELAARWMLRGGPPTPAHYVAVMEAADQRRRRGGACTEQNAGTECDVECATMTAVLLALFVLLVGCGSAEPAGASPDAASDAADVDVVAADVDVVAAPDDLAAAPDDAPTAAPDDAPTAAHDAALDGVADCGVGRVLRGVSCICAPGLVTCAGSCVDTSRDVVHCGGCARSCRADEACREGTCAVMVVATDAGGVADAPADTGCGACPPPFQCIAGRCICDGPRLLCGGACVDPLFDANHCGGCGRACPTGQTCRQGACALRCEIGLTPCGGVCRDATRSPDACGASCANCGGSAVCSRSACVTCASGWIACNNVCVDPSVNPSHCGACGNVCPSRVHATGTCVSGSCALSCAPSFADCDGNPANDCEAMLASDRDNCGTCGNVCGARSGCVGGACVCQSGAVRCGSECVRIDTADNCGACGNACTDRQSCVGTLAPACVSCGADGPDSTPRRCGNDCVNLSNDGSNCGTCGNVCGSARLCFFGVCR